MKRYLIAICCVTIVSVIGIAAVKAGYYTGPNNSLYVDIVFGSSTSMTGTIYNDTARHHKQIYVQYGNEGKWSEEVGPNVHHVSVTDKKGLLFDSDDAFTNPCWRDGSLEPGPMTCRGI